MIKHIIIWLFALLSIAPLSMQAMKVHRLIDATI